MDLSADHRVVAWLQGMMPDVEVALRPPSSDVPTGRGVSVHLVEMRPGQESRPARPEALRLQLTYLVTSWAPDARQAHDLLAQVAFAAMDDTEIELRQDPPDAAFWLAAGLVPSPALLLTVPLDQARQTLPTRPVLRPLVTRSARMGRLAGWVRTPGDVAIAGAAVEVPALDRRTRTDRGGRFSIEAVPIGGGHLQVRVRAKGREAWASVADADDHDAVLIRLDPQEESDGGVPHP